MKILSKLLMAILIMPMAFVSCSEDDDDPAPSSNNNNNNQNTSDQFVYDVDGESKDVVDSTFIFVSGNRVNLTGDESGSYPKGNIIISFPDSLSSGTYSLGRSSSVIMNYSMNTDASTSTNYDGISGTLNIVTNDPAQGIYEGSFDFTAVYVFTQDTIEITNGQFSLSE